MTHYPGSPPLMWLQERTTKTPTIIGCTACKWWIAPHTNPTRNANGRRMDRGWRYYEIIYNTHRNEAHPQPEPTPTPKKKGGEIPWEKQIPYDQINDPADPRHGTQTGINAHRKNGSTLCPACREEKRRSDRAWKNRRVAA